MNTQPAQGNILITGDGVACLADFALSGYPWVWLRIAGVHQTLLRSADDLKNARVGKSNPERSFGISHAIKYTGEIRPSCPPPSPSESRGNATQDNPQSLWEESDEWQTVRTRRSRFRQPTDQGLNKPSPKQPPGMFLLPISPLR